LIYEEFDEKLPICQCSGVLGVPHLYKYANNSLVRFFGFGLNGMIYDKTFTNLKNLLANWTHLLGLNYPFLPRKKLKRAFLIFSNFNFSPIFSDLPLKSA